MLAIKGSALFFLLINVLFVLIQGRLYGEERDKAELACVEETGVDYRLIKEVYSTQKVPTDEKYKAYLNCFHLKQGFRNQAGDINFEELKDVLVTDGGYDAVTVDKILYPCKKIKSDDPDELSVLVLSCIFENAP